MNEQDPETEAVAREIERYLIQHPDAADMMENIARWWILRQRIETSLSVTREALEQLVAQGVVECSPQGLYRLAASRRNPSAGQAPVNAND